MSAACDFSQMLRIAELVEAVGPESAYIVREILIEYLRARKKHSHWPADPVHASAILNEEAGELTQAALDFHFGPANASPERMREEAVQCGAMALRFLMNIQHYATRATNNRRAVLDAMENILEETAHA